MHILGRTPGSLASALAAAILVASGAWGGTRDVPPAEVDDTALRLHEAMVQLRARPEELGPHLELGATYYEIGNTLAARFHLETYLKAKPSGPDSLRGAYLHARTLLKAGLRHRATRALRALAKNPSAPATVDHDLSLLLREDKRVVEAVMSEMRALERGGLHPDRLREAGFQWKELRRHDQAAASFARLLETDDSATAEDWFQFAYLAHRTKRLDEARRGYETCLEMDPGHAEAHYNAGLVAEGEDRHESATFHYEQVLRLRPHYEPAYFQLGLLFLRQERAVEAVSVFQRFIGVSADSMAVAEARGLIRDLTHQVRERDGGSAR